MTDDKEERREYRKNLLWACSVDSDAVANRITELELRIKELNADYATLINHTDPDYVTGLQHRIKELEELAPSKSPSSRALQCAIQELECAINSCENIKLQTDFQSVCNWLYKVAKERAKSSSRPEGDK